MAVSIGHPAPVFSLYDTGKKKVSLEDYKGKNVVLLFFPLAFSGVCTKELCNVRDNISLYNNTNAQVIGVSVDSLYVLNKFKQEQNLNFTLLSDFNKEVAKVYDVLYETFAFDMHGVSKRAAFVIDKEGVIQHSEICATPAEMPDFTAIQDALKNLHPYENTPGS